MTDQRLSIARQVFGDPLVGYVLDLESSALDDFEVTAPRSECLDLLHGFASAIGQANDDVNRAAIQSLLLGTSPLLPTCPDIGAATAMRLLCGGDIPLVEPKDEVESLLLQLIRDAYPLLLMTIHPMPVPFPAIHSSGLFRLPTFERLQSAIMADEHLRKIFPGMSVGEANEIGSQQVWRSGVGNHKHLRTLAMSIVEHIITLAALESEPTQEGCARIARETLHSCRALARGEKVDLPVVIGLSGIELAADLDQIDLAFAELRVPTPATLAAFNWAGRESTISALLVVRATEHLVEVKTWAPERGPTNDEMTALFARSSPEIESHFREVEELATRARYALLLASEGREFIASRADTTTRLNPLEPGRQAHHALTSFHPLPRTKIEKKDALRISAWAHRVEREHPRFLDIGARRLLSAASLRLDPLDGFIDAVMCWENLFGDKQETALKVCGSLAVLLQPADPEKRRTLFIELKKLYNTRSNLVHGRPEPTTQIAHQHRDRALDIGLQAMRAAFDAPGLLRVPSSQNRFEQVLLGFPPPQ